MVAEIDQFDVDQIEIVNSFATRDPQIESIGQWLLCELQSEGLGGRLYVESLASVLAVHLVRHYSSKQSVVRESIGGLSQSRLRRILEYINNNLAQNLTLTEIAAEAGLSTYHLTRLFKQSTGLAPHQYLIQCRIERTKQLLLKGKLSISEVAVRVGFFDHSHLNRHFKRLYGVTPRTILLDSKNVLENSTNIQDSDIKDF